MQIPANMKPISATTPNINGIPIKIMNTSSIISSLPSEGFEKITNGSLILKGSKTFLPTTGPPTPAVAKEGPPTPAVAKEGPPTPALAKEGPPTPALAKEGPPTPALAKEGPYACVSTFAAAG